MEAYCTVGGLHSLCRKMKRDAATVKAVDEQVAPVCRLSGTNFPDWIHKAIAQLVQLCGELKINQYS